jgi:Type IV secretion-system coupling protein DNA-binding domain
MSTKLYALTHGSNGLLLGYALVLAPLLVGLRRGRAPLMQFVWSPLTAMAATVLAGMVVALTSPLLRPFGVSHDSLLQLFFGSAMLASVGYAAGRVLAARNSAPDSQQRRGAVVMSEQLQPRTGRPDPSNPSSPVTLAGHPIALQDETKHFKLIGTTGTGKSTAIRELLAGALGRGDRAIIADPDGGYLDTFYDASRGDAILNPFTPGAEKWSLFGEITSDYDVEQLARSLIPDSHDPDTTWIEYARTFFTALVQRCRVARISDERELLELLLNASAQELRVFLHNTAAAPFLANGNEKMLSAVRSINSSALRALKYTTQQQGPAFSVRHWVSQGRPRLAGGQGGVLFLPYIAGEIAALRSTISAWMRIAIFEAMSKGEGDQRLWFIIDELDALGEIDGLKDALARVRKFGGRCVLGLQSISQVSGTYKAAAHAIVENCGNTVIFRCSASEHGGTSEFASKLIGQREVLHTTRSRTRRPGAWRASTTTSESIKIEPAIMPSEIERLPDLHGYLKLASLPDWHRVILAPPSNSPETRGKRPTAQTATITAPLPPTSSGAHTSPATPSPPSAVPSTSPPKAVATPPSTAPRRTKSTKPAQKRPRKSRAPVQVPTGLPPMTTPTDTQQPSS